MTDSQTLAERSEEELTWFGLAVAETFRAAELALMGLIALLVTPPLLILAVVVLVPALVVAVIAAVVALPVLTIRHLHRHRGTHAHARVRRLAQIGRTDSAAAASWLGRLGARAQGKLLVERAARR
jgi:hypothetical protein